MKKIYILMIAVLLVGIAKGQWVQCTSPSFQVNSLAVKDTNLFFKDNYIRRSQIYEFNFHATLTSQSSPKKAVD